MNQDERKKKREQDTKNALVIFIVFLVILALLVVGSVLVISKVVPKNGDEGQTEHISPTEEAGSTEIPEISPPVVPAVDPVAEQAAEFVSGMTLEDKIAQMFVITPRLLTGFDGATAAGETTKEAYRNHPVGGLIYLADNLQGTEQTAAMLTNMMTIAQDRTGLPIFLSVDEEGGSVARIAGNSAFGVTNAGDMSAVGASGDAQNAYQAGLTIGTYLHELGFNVDYAPVADVLTNPDNTSIGNRSFGADSQLVADMTVSALQGLSSQGIYGVVKHFPGLGGVAEDTHETAAVSERTLEELLSQELVPFQRAIESGVSFIMVGHISVPNVTGDSAPASLSQMMVTTILREQMGYEGIVITDAMNMKAVTNTYNSDQAAVMAVNAGVDMILMPADFETAYNGLLEAVKNGTITEERINESLIRIVKVKLSMGQP